MTCPIVPPEWHDPSRGPGGHHFDYEAAVQQLDTISRYRALTDDESVMLERFLTRVHRKRVR